MMKKPIQELTITEISDFSEVGRRTFYRHYEKKEDVLIEYITILLGNFIEEMGIKNISGYEGLLDEFFIYWYEKRDFLNLLRRNNVCYFLILVSERLIDDKGFMEKGRFLFGKSENFELKMTFLIAGTFRVLQRWIYNDMNYKPLEVSKIVVDLVGGKCK